KRPVRRLHDAGFVERGRADRYLGRPGLPGIPGLDVPGVAGHDEASIASFEEPPDPGPGSFQVWVLCGPGPAAVLRAEQADFPAVARSLCIVDSPGSLLLRAHALAFRDDAVGYRQEHVAVAQGVHAVRDLDRDARV